MRHAARPGPIDAVPVLFGNAGSLLPSGVWPEDRSTTVPALSVAFGTAVAGGRTVGRSAFSVDDVERL